VTRYLCT